MQISEEQNTQQGRVNALSDKASAKKTQNSLPRIDTDSKIAPLYLDKLLKARETLLKANSVYDAVTFKINPASQKKESARVILDLQKLKETTVPKRLPIEASKMLEEFAVLRATVENIANPEAGDSGLNIFRDALVRSSKYQHAKGPSAVRYGNMIEQLGDLANFLDYMSGKNTGSKIEKASWFDVETVGNINDSIHIYDYTFYQKFKNKNGEEVTKVVSELVGFESGSRIHQKLLDLKAKISAGKEKLDKDEVWQYEYLSRLGQSFREGKMADVVDKKTKKAIGKRLAGLTSKSQAEFQTLDNLDYAINELAKLGDAQAREVSSFSVNGNTYTISNAHKRLIDNYIDATTVKKGNKRFREKAILGGHNIKRFDIPAIESMINTVPGGSEYYQYLTSKNIFGESKVVDTFDIQQNLGSKISSKVSDILGVYTKDGETMGMAEVIYRSLFPIDPNEVHHGSIVDTKQEYKSASGLLDAIIKAYEVDLRETDSYSGAIGKIKAQLVGEEDAAISEFGRGTLLMKMNLGGSHRNQAELRTMGIYGISQKGNSFSSLDGTTYAVHGFDKDGNFNVVKTEEDRFARGIWDKDSIYELVSAEQVKDAKELEMAAGTLGVHDTTRNKIFKFNMRLFGGNDGLYSREQTESVVYATQQGVENFIARNTAIGEFKDGQIIQFKSGKEWIENNIRSTSKGGFELAVENSDELVKSLTGYNTSLIQNRIAESAGRRIEDGSLSSVLKAEGIRNIAEKMTDTASGETMEQGLDRFHALMVNAIYGNNPAQGKQALEDALDFAIKQGLKVESIYGFEYKNKNLTKQALARMLMNGFRFGPKGDIQVHNSGYFDNTFYLAKNLESGSYIFDIAQKAKQENLGYDQIKAVLNETLSTIVGKNRAAYQAAGLSEEEITQKLLADMGAMSSRATDARGQFFVPLTGVGTKLARGTKGLGISFSQAGKSDAYASVNAIKAFAREALGESSQNLNDYATYIKVLHNVALNNDLWSDISGIEPEKQEEFARARKQIRDRVSKFLRDTTLTTVNGTKENRPEQIVTGKIISELEKLNELRRKYGDINSGLNPNIPFSIVKSALGKTKNDSLNPVIDKTIAKAKASLISINSDQIAGMKGSKISEDEFKKGFRGYSTRGVNERYNIFRQYQQSVRNYYSDMTRLAKEYGGQIKLRDGKFYVEFPGEGPIPIDEVMLRLEQSGNATHYRLGRSAYNAKLKVKISDSGELGLQTHLDKELGRAFYRSEGALSAAQRRMERAKKEGRPLGSSFMGVFKDIFKSIREDALQEESVLHDSSINYSFNIEELINTEYGRKKFRPILKKAKNNAQGQNLTKINDLLEWMDREDQNLLRPGASHSSTSYTGIKAKNDFWSLITDNVIPNTIRIGEYTYNIHRDAKITKAGRNGLATLFNENTTWSKPFESVGRESAYMENKTVRFNKAALESRIRKFNDAKNAAMNRTVYGTVSNTLGSILDDRSLIRHSVEVAGEELDIVGKIEKNIRVRQLEATTKDVNEIKKLMGKSMLADVFKKSSFDELNQEQKDLYKEILNRFNMRAQVFEGGGNISGRIVAASGYYQGDKSINMAYRHLENDARWNAIRDNFELDDNGQIKKFSYGNGFLVKGYNPNLDTNLPPEEMADRQLFQAISEYGDTEEQNLAPRSSIVRRRYQTRLGHTLTEDQVYRHVRDIADAKNIALTKEAFEQIASQEFETVAQVSVMSPNNYVKLFSELGEKHVSSINMEEIDMSAKWARAMGKTAQNSAILNLLENKDFQEAVQVIKKNINIDILKDNLRFDIIEDFASGNLQNEIWQQLKDAKRENNTDLYTLVKAAVDNANKLSNGSSLEEDVYSGIFSIADIVEKVTGATIISQDIAQAIKHGKEVSATEVWDKLVDFEIMRAKQGGLTEQEGINAAKARFDRVFYDKEWLDKGNAISRIIGKNYVLEDIDPENYHLDTRELAKLRKELRSEGVKIGDYISGDYLDENGKVQNVYGDSKFLVRDSIIQFMKDAANFDKKASWGIREKSSLDNAIVYASDLAEIETRMNKFNGTFSFQDIFGEAAATMKAKGENRYITWQKELGSGLAVEDLIVRNSATFALGDIIYSKGNTEPKTWIDKEKAKLYDKLVQSEYFKDAPIGDQFLTDLAESNAGKSALILQSNLIGGEYARNVTDDAKKRAKEAFGYYLDTSADKSELASMPYIVKAPQLLTDTKNALPSIRSGELERFYKFDRNFILDIAGDDEDLAKLLSDNGERYLYVSGADLRPVMPGSDTPALTPVQEQVKRISENAKEFIDLKKRLVDPNEDRTQIQKEIDLVSEKLRNASKVYLKELDNQYRNHKSILNSKWNALRQEFSDRGKVNVYDVASLLYGDEYGEVGNFEYNGKKFRNIFSGKFDSAGKMVSGPQALPDFIIASTKDLEKYGYTDKYFESAYLATHKVVDGEDIAAGVEKFKADWLKRAKTKGVAALGNRSPSDYIYSSNAINLYFSDNVTKGMSIISSITAAKMKADSDGDTAMKMMLGVRNKETAQWLDLNTFNMLTDEGRSQEKIAALKEQFGDANAIDELIELNKAHMLSMANAAFSNVNKGFLEEGSSKSAYFQFLASSDEAKGYRLKNVINKQKEQYLNRATNGIIYAHQTGTLSQTDLAKLTTEWNQAEDIAAQFFSSDLFTDEKYKAEREALNGAIKDAASLTKNAYGKALDIDNFDVKDLYTKLRNDETKDFGRLSLYNQILEAVRKNEADYGEFIKYGNRSYQESIQALEQGIKSKRRHIELLTEFALKNNQQGVGEIDTGILDMELITNAYDRYSTGLDKKSRAAVQYFKESAKEGFLTTKKGEETILQKKYLADEFKSNMNTILAGRNQNDVDAAFNNIEKLLFEHGQDVTKRAGELGQEMSHKDIIRLAIQTYRKALSSIPSEYRGSASQVRNYFMGSTVAEIAPMAMAGVPWARVHAAIRGIDDSEEVKKFQKQVFDNIAEAKRRYDAAAGETVKFSRNNTLFAARNSSRIKNIAEELVTSKLGGWNKLSIGLAIGIMSAGYAGGNPAEPADTQAQNQYARQKATPPDKMLYADQNMMPAYQGMGQQGYIININAQQPRGMHNKQAAELIKRAMTSSYNNNTININTNISEHSDIMSNADMLNYLYSAL